MEKWREMNEAKAREVLVPAWRKMNDACKASLDFNEVCSGLVEFKVAFESLGGACTLGESLRFYVIVLKIILHFRGRL